MRAGVAKRWVKRAKVFAITKGFRGRAKNCYSIAVRAAHRSMQHAYKGRKLKKRDMRQLWIQRINFASREHNINYSRFIYGLVKCNVQLNRKVLSELAIHEPRTFESLAEIAKQKHGQSLEKALADCHITEEPNLYETRVMTDSDGRLVKETAV